MKQSSVPPKRPLMELVELTKLMERMEPMKAVRVKHYGGLNAMAYEEVTRPVPGAGQVLVRVRAAGVGPWDAWVRSGQSALRQTLPLTLGSDLAGVVETVGEGVSTLRPGDDIYGVTNAEFTGAYAEYAVAEAGMLSHAPKRLSDVQAASVPVVACTAWQMVFDYGLLNATKRVLVHGGAGNVGAYAVQLAKWAGAEVIATVYKQDMDYVRSLGADQVIDASAGRFEDKVQDLDVVLDTVGGETLERSFAVLKPGGSLVSVVSKPDEEKASRHQIRGGYFIVSVSSSILAHLADLLDAGHLTPHVGEVLPLAQARLAHEMLAGKPHKPGKIVLTMQK